MRLPEPSSISASVRDALALIHLQSLDLIARGASLDAVLDALCEGIDALDPDLMSSVLLADPDGQRLWPAAGPRVPEDYKQLISPLPIASAMAACGTAAYRKERVISQPTCPCARARSAGERCAATTRRTVMRRGTRK